MALTTLIIIFDSEPSPGVRLALGMIYDLKEFEKTGLGMIYDLEELEETGGRVNFETPHVRDTLRLTNFWGEDSVGVAVSIMESVRGSSCFLESDFASKWFIEDLDSHVKQYHLQGCIKEIILDYLWMPDNWAVTNYGKNKFGLLNNILILAKRSSPFSHIKAGGIVYLPTPWQFYHGIVMSDHWKELIRVFKVEFIDYSDVESNPLVRSDMMIKDQIALCGKSVDYNLELLTIQGENVKSMKTGDLEHWRGNYDVFMKLTRN